MNTGAVYEFRFFHALFLFSSHGLGENMEVITTWDEVTKTLVADRKGERSMITASWHMMCCGESGTTDWVLA